MNLDFLHSSFSAGITFANAVDDVMQQFFDEYFSCLKTESRDNLFTVFDLCGVISSVLIEMLNLGILNDICVAVHSCLCNVGIPHDAAYNVVYSKDFDLSEIMTMFVAVLLESGVVNEESL